MQQEVAVDVPCVVASTTAADAAGAAASAAFADNDPRLHLQLLHDYDTSTQRPGSWGTAPAAAHPLLVHAFFCFDRTGHGRMQAILPYLAASPRLLLPPGLLSGVPVTAGMSSLGGGAVAPAAAAAAVIGNELVSTGGIARPAKADQVTRRDVAVLHLPSATHQLACGTLGWNVATTCVEKETRNALASRPHAVSLHQHAALHVPGQQSFPLWPFPAIELIRACLWCNVRARLQLLVMAASLQLAGGVALNQQQRLAVAALLSGGGVAAPYVLFGPPGTGETPF